MTERPEPPPFRPDRDLIGYIEEGQHGAPPLTPPHKSGIITSMKLSQIRRQTYRVARDLGDVQAATHGPTPLAKRYARKVAYRKTLGPLSRLLRKMGLG